MSEDSTLYDGNPRAPILPEGTKLDRRDVPTLFERQMTAFQDWHANRYSDREKRLAVRSVHAGSMAHDTESAA